MAKVECLHAAAPPGDTHSRAPGSRGGKVQRTVIRRPWGKTLRVLCLGALMTAASAWLVHASAPRDRLGMAVGWFALAFFGGGTLVLLLTSWPGRAVLVLDAQGVDVLGSAFGRVRIPWDDLDHLVVNQVFGQRMLGFAVRDPERWLSLHSPAARVLVDANQAFGAPYWVAESTLPGTCEDVVALIRRYRDLPVVSRE